MKILKIILIIILILVLIAVVGVIACYVITKDAKLDIDKLDVKQTNVTLLDSLGQEMIIKNNVFTPISEISEDIISTFIAVEDKRFYKHNGIDVIRILSATANNVLSWSFKEGASTITQQLIKNTHFSSDKTVTRKLSEIKLALDIEKKYSKDEIIEMYLNVVYFGSGIYGINDACLAYFDKLPSEINLSEACILAGVVKNPSKNSPITNIEGAKARQSVIFNILENQGNIDKSTLNKARLYNIVIKNGLKENTFSHSYIKNALAECSEILDMSESEIVKNGYKISTFFDAKTQKTMHEKAMNNPNISENYFTYSTINNDGVGVSSYVSNVPLLDSQIKRQAGSTIKPFSTFLPALSQKIINPLTQILDEKIDINGYSPNNYNGVYHGYVSIADSIINSYNIPAVKILEKVGIDNSVNYLNKVGLDVRDNEKNLSLALGSNVVSPLAIASSYTSLANYGTYQKAHFISSILDSEGKVIYRSQSKGSEAYDSDDAFIMTDMLLETSKNGTGRKLNGLDYDIASKTGTVSAGKGTNTDGWCVAYTSSHTFIAWHGSRTDEVLDNTHSGSNYPTLMVREMCELLYSNSKPTDFEPTDGVTLCKINKEELSTNQNIYRQQDNCNEPYILSYFNNDNLPEYYSNSEISIPFTVTKQGIYNKIEFNCDNGADYQVYKTDIFGNVNLLRTITANGNKVSIIDSNSILFNFDSYHIMKVDKSDNDIVQ